MVVQIKAAPMVNASYIFKVREETASSLLPVLRQITGRTQDVRGCLQSTIWQNETNQELMIRELWQSIDYFKAHINSGLYKKMLAALEMSDELPVIQFIDCNQINGIEFIEELMHENETSTMRQST